ncbi:hypothetical protein BC332_07954 [Capsicum chinense]|nr:hypothetical protein BC332_07954 [Capsicum chinense]
MSFFLTLRSVQTLPDPKVIDGIKMELFEATTITRKIILEGGFVTVDDGSRSGNGSGNGAAVGDNDAPLTIFETTNCKEKHDGVINAINALTASVKKITSKRSVIPSKRISYPYTPLEIKAAKRRRKDTSKALSSIEKSKIATPLSFSCIDIQCARFTEDQHKPKKMDITIEAITEEHNITVYNPSTSSKEEEKVEPISLGERMIYPFEGFNISDEAKKKLIQLINDYSKWIVDGLLKHHAGRKQNDKRYKVNESSLGFDMFDFVVAHLEMKNLFYLMSQSQTCWNDEVRTDWSTIEAYRDKMDNPFDAKYVEGIAQQTIGIAVLLLPLMPSIWAMDYKYQMMDLILDYSAKDMLLFYENTEKQKIRILPPSSPCQAS